MHHLGVDSVLILQLVVELAVAVLTVLGVNVFEEVFLTLKVHFQVPQIPAKINDLVLHSKEFMQNCLL